MTIRLSRSLLFSLLSLFLLGSAWLFGLGSEARQDAWLAILVGLAISIPMVWANLALQSRFEGETMVQYIPHIVGLVLGKSLSLLYLLYFLYLAARVTRDFAELAIIAILPDTPIGILIALMSVLGVYGARQGLETLARTTQILLPIALGAVLLSSVLIVRDFRLTNLQPFLEGGLPGIWRAAFPLTVTVPFGESIVFGMIWSHLPERRIRTALGALVASGFLLCYLMLIETGVLGPHLIRTSNFPLLMLVRQLSVGEFLERLDAAAVIVMTLGGFTKISVYLYATVAGLAQWLDLSDHRPLALPLGAVMAAMAYAIAASYPEHITIGLKQVPYLLHIPLQIIAPILLLLIAWLRSLGRTRPEPPQ